MTRDMERSALSEAQVLTSRAARSQLAKKSPENLFVRNAAPEADQTEDVIPIRWTSICIAKSFNIERERSKMLRSSQEIIKDQVAFFAPLLYDPDYHSAQQECDASWTSPSTVFQKPFDRSGGSRRQQAWFKIGQNKAQAGIHCGWRSYSTS